MENPTMSKGRLKAVKANKYKTMLKNHAAVVLSVAPNSFIGKEKATQIKHNETIAPT
jgi:hypothetical protein